MLPLVIAYNTNGLAHHNLLDAIALLAEFGYEGISITLDHGVLNPYDDRLEIQLNQVAAALQKHQLRCVIETGARYLLDPRNKHEPTLVTADQAGRARRIDFLCRSIEIAAHLNADCVSLWSGVVHDGAGQLEAFSRLVDGLSTVLAHADKNGVNLAFEPEPGMLIDTLESYDQLLAELAANGVDASRLRLTIDVGHLHCQGELPIPEKMRRWGDRLANVHIEDMRAGVHEHLMFGDGEIDFPPVIAALTEIGYDGLLSVELSRYSHEGAVAAERAYNYLRPLVAVASGAKK
jgi:L-ribulose-5-phosphate 3-epimerase